MARQPFFPRRVPQRPEWFGNYGTQLVLANAILNLPAADVAASVADARYCEYASGQWLTAVREFGPACTSALQDLYEGPAGTPFVLPAFTAPALPAGVTAVLAGALLRIFAFVQIIKNSPHYTEAIGLLLGIVGPEETPPPPDSRPRFKVTVLQGAANQLARLEFFKDGHQGLWIEGRRGNGAWEFLAIDTESPYVDERPLLVAGQPETREYRVRFWDDAPNGEWSDVAKVTVSP